MDKNYFICTLGQAAQPDTSRPFHNINHLIDQQASHHPDLSAVGFYTNGKHEAFKTQIVSFSGVLQGVLATANAIAKKINIEEHQTVGLLSNSSPAFLFTWLGLIRLGHPVLLIAPQCSASAIAHLSKSCNAPVLFHDEAHERLAQEAVKCSSEVDFSTMSTHNLPFEDDETLFQLVRRKQRLNIEFPEITDTDVAYLHHTSGTSTGIPKPIPQSHKGGVGVLPSLDGTAAATFTTTPLYHGGVADLFRAWTSNAMIWLFPSQHFPITATNIVKCLDASASAVVTKSTPAVRYFSSVPYVLQMMAQDDHGLKHLQDMDIVGVGGAALPPEVGDDLVNKRVNLVSRYGSAECGFLMSSHRDYEKDKQWQYLRKAEEVGHLKFEQQDDGQSELVIKAGWPHMAKTNREDGSFATSDLFAPHPTTPNAWKYHSRADSQLALITGKKFDPAPLEGSLAASSSLLSEVLIFGNGKPYPGALLFRSQDGRDMNDSDLVSRLTSMVEKLNRESQSHARIPRNMLIPMPFEISPLEKSSKGTILRGSAEDKYREQIENAYERTTFDGGNVEDSEVPNAISKIIDSVVGDTRGDQPALADDTDLFAYGVDSVACVQIRHALTQLLPEKAGPLPLTVVEDSGTISILSQTIIQLRRGEQVQNESDQVQTLHHFVEEYSSFEDIEIISRYSKDKVGAQNILLTGPTGLLGTNVLSQAMANPYTKKIYLLVRGATPRAAKERVTKALTSRKLQVPSNFDEKVCVVPCKLSEPMLGLSDETYRLLTDEVDTIIHLAWAVNFLVSLRSLASVHLAGLQNLLTLTLRSKRNPRFLFCSSVASMSNLIGERQIPEEIVHDVSACGKTGYAQSKLAAELICAKYAANTGLKDRITIIRVGQLSGDTKEGVWNASEAYPLMLASSKVTGTLPDLKNETLGWLPVDVAANCFVEAAELENKRSFSTSTNGTTDGGEGIKVFNLLNTSKATTFKDLARCLQNAGEQVKVVSVNEWLDTLAQLQDSEETKKHVALKLLPFWKEVYGAKTPAKPQSVDPVLGSGSRDRSGGEREEYEMHLSKASMSSLEAAIGPLSEEYLQKLWSWVKENVD